MKQFSYLAVFACALTLAMPDSNAQQINVSNLPLHQFLKCNSTDPKSQQFFETIRAQQKPLRKLDWAWIYKANGGTASKLAARLQVSELWLGVCGVDGNLGCGQAMYVALVLNTSVEDSRQILQQAFKQDFTVEKLDPESGIPLRALLQKTDRPSESLLVCGSGSL